MFMDKLLKSFKIGSGFCLVDNWMSCHWHRDSMATRFHAGIDLCECFGSTVRLPCTAFQAVLESVQRLPDRVRERDCCVVDERNLPDSPPLQGAD